MKRQRYIWPVFCLCLLAVLAGMGWISMLALDLEQTRLQADQEARFQQRVRLALWRLDSAAQPLILQENARPHYVYQAFYAPRLAYTRTYAQIAADEVLIPSHLLFFESPWIRLHFQVEPDGRITSPEVPTGTGLEEMEQRYDLGPQINRASERLEQLRRILRAHSLAGQLPETVPAPETLVVLRPVRTDDENNAPQQMAAQQKEWNRNEFLVRSRTNNSNFALIEPNEGVGSSGPARGPFGRIWVGPALLMARRVQFDQAELIQGCWLDWQNLRKWLLSHVTDLLPQADLVPAVGQRRDEGTRLASLPVRLEPGPVDVVRPAAWSPVRYALLVAWICVLVGAGAVAAVLAQAVSLSRRRGAFVSAVTHEMRTPLTTFRLYSEMLSEGMVRDESKRDGYLQRLRGEADRLSHLVENVLAYARLTGPRSAARLETVSVDRLIGQVSDRLANRAGQAGLELRVDHQATGVEVRADVSAVEQILLNLIDNACKYASGGRQCQVTLSSRIEDGWVRLQVADRGPGIDPARQGRLFKPFGKSAEQAAGSAPGIGLGLALSRRLARNMGGNLELDAEYRGGARFVLSLRRRGD